MMANRDLISTVMALGMMSVGFSGFGLGTFFFAGCVPYLCQKDTDSWRSPE
jgi:hypothetical protein